MIAQKYSTACVFITVSVVFGILLPSSAMAENKAEVQVLEGNNHFTCNLYRVLSDTEDNVLFSPISVHAVLAMAYQGSQGTTAERLATTLQVPDTQVAAEGYNSVMKRLNSIENVTLLMANKVYLMSGHKMLDGFSSAITKHFLSEVKEVDFQASTAAAKTINDWVEMQTRNKIKDLINEADLNHLTRLVLVNAIYFKGNWKHQFSKEKTRNEPFYLNENDTVDVEMMYITEKFNYKRDNDLDAQFLEMPYANEDLSMVIILPNKKSGIQDLEEKLATFNLADITKDMHKIKVTVALPKFKIEQTIDLKEPLTKLGLGEIFNEDKANFRGMIELQPDENLYVSKAVQKVFIEVNEEGAEAAAATGAVIKMKRSLEISEEFYVNHPFIWCLIEKYHDTITVLFYGKAAKIPSSSSQSSAVHDEF